MSSDEVLALCLYAATSASELRTEPPEYGSLRLVEVLSRLAETGAAEHGDSFLAHLADHAREVKSFLMTDHDAFYRDLDGIVIELVRESKLRRQSAGEAVASPRET